MCKKTHSEPSVRQTKKKNKRKAILEETDRGRSRGGAGFHGDRDAPSSCRLLSLFLDADRPPRPTPSLHAGSASQPSRNKYARGCSGKTASNQSFPDYLPLCGAIFFNPAPIALLSALFCLPSTLPYRSSPLCPSAPPNIPSGCVPTLFATPSFRFHPPYPPLCLPVLETTVPCTLFPACLSFLHVFFSLPPRLLGSAGDLGHGYAAHLARSLFLLVTTRREHFATGFQRLRVSTEVSISSVPASRRETQPSSSCASSFPKPSKLRLHRQPFACTCTLRTGTSCRRIEAAFAGGRGVSSYFVHFHSAAALQMEWQVTFDRFDALADLRLYCVWRYGGRRQRAFLLLCSVGFFFFSTGMPSTSLPWYRCRRAGVSSLVTLCEWF